MRFTNLPSTSSAIDLGQNEAFRGNAGLSVVSKSWLPCRCNRRLQMRAENNVK
jgi:hypothetical protein